jgi:hypothetical protein
MACAQAHLPEVRAWIQLHPALFGVTFAPRQVNNIYLDTHAANDLNAHLSGVARRQKLRYRWYGEDHTAARGSLELKCRSGNLGWKLLVPIPQTFDLSRLSWYEWMEQLRIQASGPAVAWLSDIERPTLINAYRREYFESAEDQIRLTIDHPMRAYDQTAYSAPNFSFGIPSDQVIVEIKAPLAYWERLPDLLSRFPLRTSRNSKYVSGMTSTLAL